MLDFLECVLSGLHHSMLHSKTINKANLLFTLKWEDLKTYQSQHEMTMIPQCRLFCIDLKGVYTGFDNFQQISTKELGCSLMSCQKSKHIISMDTLIGEWQWALALLKEMALGSFYDVISFNSPLATGTRYFTADSVSAEISCHSAYQSIEGFLIKLSGKEIWQSTFEVKVASLSHYLQVFVTILSAASFGFRIRYLRCYQRHLEESARGEHEFGQLKRHNTWVHLPMMSQICVGFFHHKVMTMFFSEIVRFYSRVANPGW